MDIRLNELNKRTNLFLNPSNQTKDPNETPRQKVNLTYGHHSSVQ